MMSKLRNHKFWNEPKLGHLFGEFYANTPKEKVNSAHFIMGTPNREGSISSIRRFVLVGALYAFPFLCPRYYWSLRNRAAE